MMCQLLKTNHNHTPGKLRTFTEEIQPSYMSLERLRDLGRASTPSSQLEFHDVHLSYGL